MTVTKEHLEGRASVLGEVIGLLDERLAKGCGTWAYELRQELARVKTVTEKQAGDSPSDYQQGYVHGLNVGHDSGYELGYETGRKYPQPR